MIIPERLMKSNGDLIKLNLNKSNLNICFTLVFVIILLSFDTFGHNSGDFSHSMTGANCAGPVDCTPTCVPACDSQCTERCNIAYYGCKKVEFNTSISFDDLPVNINFYGGPNCTNIASSLRIENLPFIDDTWLNNALMTIPGTASLKNPTNSTWTCQAMHWHEKIGGIRYGDPCPKWKYITTLNIQQGQLDLQQSYGIRWPVPSCGSEPTVGSSCTNNGYVCYGWPGWRDGGDDMRKNF